MFSFPLRIISKSGVPSGVDDLHGRTLQTIIKKIKGTRKGGSRGKELRPSASPLFTKNVCC